MGEVTPRTTQRELPKKEWHSTYYKLMKQFAVSKLRITAESKKPNLQIVSQVVEMDRDLAQLFKVTSNTRSEADANFVALKTSYTQLGTSKKQGAIEAINLNKASFEELDSLCNKMRGAKDLLTENVKGFLEKAARTFPEIDQVLNKGDIAKAENLLNELTNEVKKLKTDLKTVQDQEKKIQDGVEKINPMIAQALRSHVGVVPVTTELPKLE